MALAEALQENTLHEQVLETSPMQAMMSQAFADQRLRDEMLEAAFQEQVQEHQTTRTFIQDELNRQFDQRFPGTSSPMVGVGVMQTLKLQMEALMNQEAAAKEAKQKQRLEVKLQ